MPDDIDYSRLVSSIRSARQIQQDDREYRLKAIQRLKGEDSPVNLVEQYAKTITRALVAKEPRVHLSTTNPQHRAHVFAAKQWFNEEIQRQELARVFQRVTYDAYIKLGICKVALASPADLAIRGYAATIAAPLCSYVSFDDFVYDSRCNDLAQAGYVGHRFRLPLEVARNMKMYGPDRKKLMPATDGRYNAEGDLRASALDMEPYYVDAEDWVELWEIYLPRHGLVVTLADDDLAGVSAGASGDPLRVQKWIGPPCGPYVYMAFNPIPDQAMPNGTMRSLLILDAAVNRLYRKLINQAERQKQNTLVDASADKDNKLLRDANDGDMVPVGNPNAFTQVSRGGPDKVNNAFSMELRDIFNRLGGNIETLAGSAPQAKTLGQEQILNTNSSATLAEMQTESNRFAAQVCKNSLWYEWYHPTRAMETEYTVPGAPHISAPLKLSAVDRHNIPFEKLGLKVDPYSMGFRSPQQTLEALTQAVVQVFLPLLPLMKEAGVSINVGRFAEMFGELQDMPEMAQIIETAGPQMVGAEDDGGGQGPQGTRTYERVSTSEKTQPGQDTSARMALLGADAGGSESTEAA